MKSKVVLCVLALMGTAFEAKAENTSEIGGKEKWNLVWADEFEGEKVDRSKWTYQTGNGFWSDGSWISGWGNNELEYYTDREENVRLENGELVITARKEKYKGQYGNEEKNYDYTSGKILSKGLFSKKYGRFEMRAKFPTGKGLWPAMWLLPQDDIYGGWAASGEIDIFEGWGSKPDTISGTLHYGSTWPDNVYTGKEHELEGSTVSEYHEYALEWMPGEIKWYIDGEVYQVQNDWYSKNKNEAVNYTYPAPFDQDFYLIFNLAVGGWFDGEPDSNTEFPGEMKVDYIRVYDLEGGYEENVKAPETAKAELTGDIKKAVDNNYIYNGNFQEGEKEWQLLGHFGGSVNYIFDDLNGDGYLKAEISNGGEQTYSVQIIQEAPVVKGHWYKLSFDSKAEENREIAIKIGGGESRGWKAYYSNTYNLTKDMNRYTAIFQMKEDTDKNAKIEFHGGLSVTDFWLGNVKLEVIDNPDEEIKDMNKLPLANGNQIYNGTFDQGMENRMQFWNFETGGSSRAEVIDRRMVIDSNGDKSNLYQKNIPLLEGGTYKLKFKAANEAGESIAVKIADSSGSKEYFSKEIILTGELDEYEVEVPFDYPTDLGATFAIEFGGNKSITTLDDFHLEKAVDYSKIQTVLIDDDFSSADSKKNWTAWMGKEYGFGGEYGFYIKKGKAKMAIRDLGAEVWSNLFYQNVALVKGIKYKLTFDISSSRNREVTVAIENASYQRKASRVLKTSKKDQKVEMEFVADKTEEVGVKFLFGKYPKASKRAHNIYLDNVKLEVIKE